MGAIIFEGKFMVRGQLSGGKFFLGAIIQGTIIWGAIVVEPLMPTSLVLKLLCILSASFLAYGSFVKVI